MRCCPLVLLVFALPFWAGSAAAARRSAPAPKSLITGTWGRDKLLGSACAESVICLDSLFQVRLEDVSTLSGPVVGETIGVRFGAHGRPRPEYRVVLVVWRNGNDRIWTGFPLSGARAGEEACVDLATFREAGAPIPRQARVTKDRICVIA